MPVPRIRCGGSGCGTGRFIGSGSSRWGRTGSALIDPQLRKAIEYLEGKIGGKRAEPGKAKEFFFHCVAECCRTSSLKSTNRTSSGRPTLWRNSDAVANPTRAASEADSRRPQHQGGKRDALAGVLMGQFERAAKGGGEQLRFAALAPDQIGPTAWITYFTCNSPAVEMTAEPVGQPFGYRSRISRIIASPPRRWIAPSTPPPPASWLFAAYPMASACSSVMSPPPQALPPPLPPLPLPSPPLLLLLLLPLPFLTPTLPPPPPWSRPMPCERREQPTGRCGGGVDGAIHHRGGAGDYAGNARAVISKRLPHHSAVISTAGLLQVPMVHYPRWANLVGWPRAKRSCSPPPPPLAIGPWRACRSIASPP